MRCGPTRPRPRWPIIPSRRWPLPRQHRQPASRPERMRTSRRAVQPARTCRAGSTASSTMTDAFLLEAPREDAARNHRRPPQARAPGGLERRAPAAAGAGSARPHPSRRRSARPRRDQRGRVAEGDLPRQGPRGPRRRRPPEGSRTAVFSLRRRRRARRQSCRPCQARFSFYGCSAPIRSRPR